MGWRANFCFGGDDPNVEIYVQVKFGDETITGNYVMNKTV